MLNLTQSVAPGVEPVSLADAKAHLRIEHTADDELLLRMIQAARLQVEMITQRQLISATWVLRLDAFPSDTAVIRLPRAPVQSITSVQYVDTAGDSQTLDSANYTVDIYAVMARLMPAYSLVWPSTRAVPNAVTVTYVSGYGDHADDVPETFRAAIQLFVADLYEYREGSMEARLKDNATVARLLWSMRTIEVR